MKKIKTLTIALAMTFTAATISYAAFPVKKEKNEVIKSETVTKQDSETSNNETKKISMHTKSKHVKKESNNQKQSSGKSQIVALILGILVGALGIH